MAAGYGVTADHAGGAADKVFTADHLVAADHAVGADHFVACPGPSPF